MKRLLILPSLLLVCAQTVTAEAPPVGDPPPEIKMHMSQQTKDGPLKREEMNLIESVAIIEKLDVESRKMTLKGQNDKSISFTVTPAVTRLNEMKVGDKVVVQYYQSMAFEVRQPTPEEQAVPRSVVAGAAKASEYFPPGVAGGSVSKVIVEVEAIDLEAETVTIKLPEGNSATIKARVPANLKRVKIGDTVAVVYAEALAIGLKPASETS